MRKLIIISLCIFTSCSSEEKKVKQALEYCADVSFYHYMIKNNPDQDKINAVKKEIDQSNFNPWQKINAKAELKMGATEKVLSNAKKFAKKNKLSEKFSNNKYFKFYAECEDFLQVKPRTFSELYADKKFKDYKLEWKWEFNK